MAEIKLSDEQFFAILRENAGLFAKTAHAIKAAHGIDFTRQAVRQRALDHKDILDDIDDEAGDAAEDGMLTLSKSIDEKIRFQACQFLLRTRWKKRGYVERQEITGPDGKNVINELHVKIIRDKANGITPGEFTPQSTGSTESEETV